MSNVKRGGKFRRARKKVCIFCVDKAESIDYKDVAKLKKYITERGKILPRRISGTCAINRCYQEIKKYRIITIHN